LAPQDVPFIFSKLKHEIIGEPFDISLDGLIEYLRFDAVQLSQIAVKHHLLTANEEYHPLDMLDRYKRLVLTHGDYYTGGLTPYPDQRY